MRHTFAGFLLAMAYIYGLPQSTAADVPPGPAAAAAACEGSCAPAVLITPIEFSRQVAKSGDFGADIKLRQPCTCVRPLQLIVAFTPLGAKTSRERAFKLQVAPGTTTTHVALTNRELAKLKVKPGQYTVSFALHDERDQPLGERVAGESFTLGTTGEALATEPAIPASIGRAAELAVPFRFDNSGDVPAHVTALLVFTRPDSHESIEYYTPRLAVAPRGSRHVVRLSAKKRQQLGIGAGPWLVTSAAFDVSDQRFAFYPGHLLQIGKTLSQPVPPQVSPRVEPGKDLSLTLTFRNSGDNADLVTAVMLFSGAGRAKPIEYKVEGVALPVGTSTHPIVLTEQDRYNLGIRPGPWHVATTALDRAGNRIDLKRGKDFEVGAPQPH